MCSKRRDAPVGGFGRSDYGKQLGDMTPEARLQEILQQNAQIHPQALDEYAGGVSVPWHKIPWVGGGYSVWTEETRQTLYPTLVARHGRIMLAAEHTSYLPGWMEGSLLSAKSAIEEFDRVAVSQG
jgi:monoamine oxidase